MRSRVRALGVLLGALAVLSWSGLRAAQPVDDDLLEFLGSVDSEDKNWHDYLAHTDIDKVAKHAGKIPSNPPGANAPPPGNSDPPRPPSLPPAMPASPPVPKGQAAAGASAAGASAAGASAAGPKFDSRALIAAAVVRR